MMYFPLILEFMKLTKMLSRVVIFVFSKYGKKTPQSSIVGITFGKPRTTEKSKGVNLRAQMASI
jgi:hypothetical protein